VKVLIDACVLYPTVLREIVMGAAREGLFVPLWSPRILAEWAHSAGRTGPAGTEIARGEITLLKLHWPEAEVTPDPACEAAIDLPDAGDRHVLAAAIAGGAEILLTLNLRDFPAWALGAHGLRAMSPDALLMALWLDHPAAVERAVDTALRETERVSGRAQPLRALLKRARLPRLGKALERSAV